MVFFLIVLASFGFAEENGFEESTIEIIKPTETLIQKNQELEIEVKVITPEGNTIESVMASSYGMGFNDLELEKNSKGNYEGSIVVDNTSGGGNTSLEIRAKIKTGTGDMIDVYEEIRLEIERQEIEFDFEVLPGAPYYFKSKIEKIKLDVAYSDGTKLKASDLEPVNVNINNESLRLVFEDDPESDSLIAELDVELGFSDSERDDSIKYRFEIPSIQDRHGNYSNSFTSKNIRVKDKHPLVKMRVKGFDSYTEVFGGTKLELKVSVTTELGNERVFLIENNEERDCEKVSEENGKTEFLCELQLPSADEESNIGVAVIAQAGDAYSYQLLMIEISDMVFLELEHPSQYGMFLGDTDKVMVEIFVAMGIEQQIDLKEVPATINGTKVVFVWDEEEELFVADYDLTSLVGSDDTSLEIILEGLEAEREIFNVNLTEQPGFQDFDGDYPAGPYPDNSPETMLIPIGVIVLIFIGAIYFIALKKKKGESTEELEEKAKRLKNLLKRIEIEYYKRRLNEEDYKKRNLEYQTELDDVLSKLSVRKGKNKD